MERSRSGSIKVKVVSKSKPVSSNNSPRGSTNSCESDELSIDRDPEIVDNYTENIKEIPLVYDEVPKTHKSLNYGEMKNYGCLSLGHELYAGYLCNHGVFILMFNEDEGVTNYVYDYERTVEVKKLQVEYGIKHTEVLQPNKILEVEVTKELRRLATELLIQNIRAISVDVGQLLVNGEKKIYLLVYNNVTITELKLSETLIKTKLRSSIKIPTVYKVKIIREIDDNITEFKKKVINSEWIIKVEKKADARYKLIVDNSTLLTVRLNLAYRKTSNMKNRMLLFDKITFNTLLTVDKETFKKCKKIVNSELYDEFMNLETPVLPMTLTIRGTVLGLIVNGIFAPKNRKLVHMLVVGCESRDRVQVKFTGDEKVQVGKLYDLGINVSLSPRITLLYEITNPANVDIHNAIMLEKFL